jgi:hypothetical protein
MALAALLSATPAAAHGAPSARSYETRLLSDYSDDWPGTQDGHNLIALDAHEEYNATLADNVLVLRLWWSGGWVDTAPAPDPTPKEALRDEVLFTSRGRAYSFNFTTADNLVFGGTFDAVHQPVPVLKDDGTQDSGRFTVEGLVTFSHLGLRAGDRLTGWAVHGFAGTAAGDNMPQGTVAQEPVDPMGIAFNIGTFALSDPDYYAALSTPQMAGAEPGDAHAHFDVVVENMLPDDAQAVRLVFTIPEGVEMTFVPSFGSSLLDGVAANLTGGGNVTVHVTAHLEDATPGVYVVNISAKTSLGGRTLHQMVLNVPDPRTGEGTNGTPSGIGTVTVTKTVTSGGTSSGSSQSKASPAVGPTLAAAIGALAWAMRRRLP